MGDMRTPTTPRDLALGVLGGLLIASVLWWFFRGDAQDRSVEASGTGVVRGPASSLTISGDASSPIEPGLMVPLDLSLDNPNDFDLSIERITVTVQKVVAPRADADHPCSAADFEVRQFSGGVVLSLPGNHTGALSGLGLARDHWPAVGMVNTSVNQDGCKGASLTLGYHASGVEVHR
jgi:hypothetical protein